MTSNQKTIDSTNLEFRPITDKDNAAMANLIRSVMGEFNAVGCGYSIEDAEVDSMFQAYSGEKAAYFVALRAGELLAGAGIAHLEGGSANVCELKKMYALPSARGLGLGKALLSICIQAAQEAGYRQCYLETLQHMNGARRLYEKAGFQRIDQPMGNTGHFGCDCWYLKTL